VEQPVRAGSLSGFLWWTVAGYTPVQYVPPIATFVMVVVVPAALALASLLGAWPRRRGPACGWLTPCAK
jgi:hypothetical protein